MQDPYNLYNLEAPFREFLIAGNANRITIRNYLSDFRYFCGWLDQSKGSQESQKQLSLGEVVNIEKVNLYKNFLIVSKFPSSSINRKLSTLRKFCSFCISQGWMKENPGKQISVPAGWGMCIVNTGSNLLAVLRNSFLDNSCSLVFAI